MQIAVLGAGSIGVYVGGSLLAASVAKIAGVADMDVVLIGRARMRAQIAQHGVLLTDWQGGRVTLSPDQVPYSDDPALLSGADLILVTVKSADTAQAAASILAHARPATLIISLQNGIGNADTLRQHLPGWQGQILAGMVPFNVLQTGAGRLHRGTEGELMVETAPAALQRWHPVFQAAKLPLREQDNFTAVQWGKLLLNLNNPVNALAGIPLKAELSQRAYRRALALLIEEALAVLAAAGIKPAKIAKVGPRWLPMILRLPDPLFKHIAAAMLKIDPEARSSMWEDLQAGRRTEIDYLNGAVVSLAEAIGRPAPFNRRIVALIRAAEDTPGKAPAFSAAALYRTLTAS
jgi:2-dehydropantoate 2-reductase